MTTRFVLDRAAYNFETGPMGLCGEAMRRGARRIADQASMNVTIYGRVRTGFMRSSINKSGVEGSGGPGGHLLITVFVLPPYSHFQHNGTRYIAPAPFLLDAARTAGAIDFAV